MFSKIFFDSSGQFSMRYIKDFGFLLISFLVKNSVIIYLVLEVIKSL